MKSRPSWDSLKKPVLYREMLSLKTLKKKKSQKTGVDKVAQWVKVLATKGEDPSWIPMIFWE